MKSVEATSSHRQTGIRPMIASVSFAHRLDRALSAAARVLRGERPHPNLRLPLALDSLEVRALLSTITVHIFNNDFSINPKGQPIADAIINVGDTIHWVWDDPDPSPHNTRSVTGSLESWNSGAPTFPPASFDHTFNNAGVFTYYSTPDGTDNGDGTASGMTGTITVSSPTTTPTQPTPSPTPPLITVIDVRSVEDSKHRLTQIKVDFSGTVNLTAATNLATYRLAIAGKGGSFTARNSRVIPLKMATYTPALAEVTLVPRKPFKLTNPVQLRVDGVPPTGLHDNLGRLIDGNHDGLPGGNAVAVLRRKGVTLSALTLSHVSARPTPAAIIAQALVPEEIIGMTQTAHSMHLKHRLRS
jgi:plastocyanin